MVKECILKKSPEERILVMGDFNHYLPEVQKNMELMGLKPVIDQATHERGNQLDQIFTNLEVQGAGVYFLEGSDHAMLAAEVRIPPANKEQLPGGVGN